MITTLLFCIQILFGSSVAGSYSIDSPDSLSSLRIDSSGEFFYSYSPGFSCFLWHEFEGEWSLRKDTLILAWEYEEINVGAKSMDAQAAAMGEMRYLIIEGGSLWSLPMNEYDPSQKMIRKQDGR